MGQADRGRTSNIGSLDYRWYGSRLARERIFRLGRLSWQGAHTRVDIANAPKGKWDTRANWATSKLRTIQTTVTTLTTITAIPATSTQSNCCSPSHRPQSIENPDGLRQPYRRDAVTHPRGNDRVPFGKAGRV